jgi:PAS domain-containing protein
MPPDVFNPQTLLTYQLQPSVVLDADGIVLATTQSCRRLIISTDLEPPHIASDPLVGQNVSSLGLAIQPGTTSVRTWSELLHAAYSRNTSEYGMYPPVDTGNPEASGEDDSFWDEEAAREGTIEINVFVARRQDISSIVQARATVCWMHRHDHGYFLVTLSRTSLPHVHSPTPSARARGSIEFFSYSVQDDHSSIRGPRDFLPQDGVVDQELKLPVLSPMDIASPMIPHFTATLDLNGQVTKLSREWYDFTGLTEEESLGSGWYA